MGEYRSIRDASLWVEERGEGDAVLLLHGGMSDVDEFDSNLFLLADRFRVIGYDRRGVRTQCRHRTVHDGGDG